MLRVLNIASFIPIEGFPNIENDISLKIYGDLNKAYGIESYFVKPVGHIPFWLPLFKKSLKKRRSLILNKNYYDKNYNLKVFFYQSSLPLLNRLPLNKRFVKPLEYQLYSSQLEKIIQELQPDIIHAHTAFPDAYDALKLSKKFKIPYIVTIRGLYNKYYKRRFITDALTNAKAVTTPSYSLYEKVSPNFDLKLIPHGIDDFWFNQEEKNFEKDPIKLITIARLMDWKNIHVVLSAIAELKEEGINIEYSIVGEGPFRSELETLVSKLNISTIVKFYGWLSKEEIRKVCALNDIFIMLSFPETFGRAFFEAAAQGLLVIGAKYTGAYGHLSEDEAYFIDIDKEQIKKTLKQLNPEDYTIKTTLSKKKMLKYKNSNVIEEYYTILNNAVERSNEEKNSNC